MKEVKAFVFGQRTVGLIPHWWRVCNPRERADPEVLVVPIGYAEGTTGISLLIS